MAGKNGKVATKGQKQIAEENKDTLRFYLYLIIGINAFYFTLMILLFKDTFSWGIIFLLFMSAAVYFGSYGILKSMSQATYDPVSGALLDGGIDLNMESGMAENIKDLVILTCSTQLFSIISSYFWLLLLLAPIRAFYMLWINILQPWFFAPAPDELMDEKKKKKLERRMNRRVR